MYSDLFKEIFTVKSKFYAFYTYNASVLVFIRYHILTHVSIYAGFIFNVVRYCMQFYVNVLYVQTYVLLEEIAVHYSAT